MSIHASGKASVTTMRDPVLIWTKLKETFQAVPEASIDAKLTKLQAMSMESSDFIV